MHELAIAENLVGIVREQAEQYNMKRVKSLRLVVGELSLVVPEALEFSFEFVSKGTIAEGARLEFRRVPLTGECPQCGSEAPIDAERFVCATCASTPTRLTKGQEFFLDSIEYE